jgi:hypothetical protein
MSARFSSRMIQGLGKILCSEIHKLLNSIESIATAVEDTILITVYERSIKLTGN